MDIPYTYRPTLASAKVSSDLVVTNGTPTATMLDVVRETEAPFEATDEVTNAGAMKAEDGWVTTRHATVAATSANALLPEKSMVTQLSLQDKMLWMMQC